MKIKPGDFVKMGKTLRRTLIHNHCTRHVREFERCAGEVLTFTGPTESGGEQWVDVRWYPSGLRYGYPVAELVKL